jgi:hypothetical protein
MKKLISIGINAGFRSAHYARLNEWTATAPKTKAAAAAARAGNLQQNCQVASWQFRADK